MFEREACSVHREVSTQCSPSLGCYSRSVEGLLGQAVHVPDVGEEHVQVAHRPDQLANHADGLLARGDIDAVFTSICFKTALLDGSRCRDYWVSRS